MNRTIIYSCILCLMFLTPAYASEIELGMDYGSGQDESRALVLGVKVPLPGEISLSSKIRYAKWNDDISQNQGILRAGWDPKLTEDWSLWFYDQIGYDSPKEIDFEHFAGGGPKYVLHKSNRSKYSISAGYLNHYQRFADDSRHAIHRLSFRLKAKQLLYFDVILPAGDKIEGTGPDLTATFFYQPNIEDSEDYLFSGEIALSYAIQKDVRIKAFVEDHYRSVSEIPQKNELLSGLKVVVSF